ncbi:MAG TPA: ABC transporter ATP-binding protein [Streptosporangiaceae bacterium]|nr:ABC transporter ATP-binding protein [Streptosporangiaceae bacterium]
MTAATHTATRPGLWRKTASLVSPWRRSLSVVAVTIVASALAELVPPLVVGYVTNHNLVPHRSAGLLIAGVFYVAAIGVDGLLTFAYSYIAARVSQSAIAAMRVRLFEHVMTLPATYFDQTAVGDVISRSTADVETVDELFTDGIVTLIGQMVPLITTAVAMVVLSPPLSLVAVLALPPLVIITRYLQVRVRAAERATRVAIGNINVELAEDVGAVETLRVFGRESVFIDRFRATLHRTLLAQRSSVKYNAYFAPVTGLLSSVVIAALIWAGAGRTLVSAGADLGTLVAFILLFQNFFAPIIALGDEWQTVQASIAGAERVFAVLDLEPEQPPAAASPAKPRSGIRVSDLSYAYQNGQPVLSGVFLSVEPGEQVAVVGRTGAGKSTLVSVVGGLYPPLAGSVRVDGVDPRTLSSDDRRATIGVVPQNLQLFSGSVRDNLTLFDASTADRLLWHALSVAGIDGVFRQLPAGLDTQLAGGGRGGGLMLSAGQRQLLALARAITPGPAVLLLDEATASIDGASDARFRAALRTTAMRDGCAVLTVAHRISTAKEADRVVVMEHGQIVEQGTPSALLAHGGRFARLAELESAGWDWRNDTEPDSGPGLT